MQFELDRADGADGLIAASDNPRIRLFQVQGAIEFEPQRDLRGTWMRCTPETTPKFSALAYLFGREIESRLHVPVGLVHASQGWTPGEAWMSRESLMGEPSLRYLVEAWDKVTEEFPRLSGEHAAKMDEWRKAADAAKEKGAEPPPQPRGPMDPRFLHRASGFYNGCIAPMAGLAMRGVIWYQGETNEVRGHEYRVLFPALIQGWRKAWARDFPFLFVQVAAVLPPDPEPVPSEWAELRESQALALRLPQTGMACTIDIGDRDDVHPRNKLEAARRLALVARAKVYGETDLVFSGPVFKKAVFEDGKARVAFDHIGGGLVAKDGPPATFQLAGEDRKFVYAQAEIDGDSVVVSSEAVPNPVAVRYAWNNNPEGCNLYNAEGLPCVPFRSDDWPCKTLDSRDAMVLQQAP
jgi:sialate O-acetylesterase